MLKEIQKQLSLPMLMSRVFAWVENRAKALDTSIYPDKYSKPRLPVGSSTPAERHPKWEAPTEEIQKQQKHYMGRNFRAAWKSYRYLKTPQQAQKDTITSEQLAELEALAIEMGASAIGYTKVPADMIFEGMAIPHDNAIVIVSEMERPAMDKAPHPEVMREVVKTYATTTEIANELTERLREDSYSAYSGISIGGAVDHVRLAASANLGAIGYHGLLISPHSGARLRINVLYTNITNLPFTETREHDWVLDFCAMCTKCIRGCPAKAIKLNPPVDEIGRREVLDSKACSDYMVANHTCSVCMSICPFSRAGYDKIKANFKRVDK